MGRWFYITGLAALAAIGGFIGYSAVWNPVQAQSEGLEDQLGRIEPTQVEFAEPKWDFEAWRKAILGKKSLWTEVVPPPPPPAPPPPRPPDVERMLDGVEVTRQQVGDNKIKIKTKTDPKGSFYAVGDTVVPGITLKEIARTNVTFSNMWGGLEQTAKRDRK